MWPNVGPIERCRPLSLLEAAPDEVVGKVPPGRLRALKGRLVMGALSLLVLAGMASTFASPQYTSFQAARLVSATVPANHEVVVYGKVKLAGVGADHVHVWAYHTVGSKKVSDATTQTGPKGVYRVGFRPRSGTEYIRFLKGKATGTVKMRIKPGMAYRLSGHFVTKHIFFFLPIFSY